MSGLLSTGVGDHPDTARSLNNLALLLGSMNGRSADVVGVWTECVRVYAAAYGAEHDETVDARRRLAAAAARV